MAGFNVRDQERIKTEAENFQRTRKILKPEELYDQLKKDLNEFRNQKVNVAFIGAAKSGKSSLVNAVLGQPLAQVEPNETVEKPAQPFQVNGGHNLIIWDIKGKRRRSHDDYMDDIENAKYNYDLFILVLRSEVDDVFESLFKEVLKKKRNFLVVRTHIDQDIGRGANQNRDAAQVFGSIRTDLLRTLQELAPGRLNDFQLFLVNSYDTQNHDFAQFRQALIDMCPKAKQESLIYSLESTCDQVLDLKLNALEKRIPTVSKMAAISAGVPVVGSLMESAEVILTREIVHYLEQFQLDLKSIQALEIETEIQIGQVEEFVKRSLKEVVLSGIRDKNESFILANDQRLLHATEQCAAVGAGVAAVYARAGGSFNSWQAAIAGIGFVVTTMFVGSSWSSQTFSYELLKILMELHRVAREKEKECRRLKVQALQRGQP